MTAHVILVIYLSLTYWAVPFAFIGALLLPFIRLPLLAIVFLFQKSMAETGNMLANDDEEYQKGTPIRSPKEPISVTPNLPPQCPPRTRRRQRVHLHTQDSTSGTFESNQDSRNNVPHYSEPYTNERVHFEARSETTIILSDETEDFGSVGTVGPSWIEEINESETLSIETRIQIYKELVQNQDSEEETFEECQREFEN